MLKPYGTNEGYKSAGMPAIIRRPDEAARSEGEFLATLTAGLMFAKKFHLDAAWLINSRLADLIRDRQSGIYRLILKDHVGILCRLPLEQMKVELAENPVALNLLIRKANSGHGRVWDWPTGKPRIIRKSVSTDGMWEIPTLAPREHTFVASDDKEKVGSSLAKHFVSVPETDVSPPSRFFAVLGAIGSHGIANSLSPTSPLEERLCWVTFEDLEIALRSPAIDRVLGSLREESIIRNDLCYEIYRSLISGKTDVMKNALALLRSVTPELAELLGIRIDFGPSTKGFAVSARDAISFLFSWD